MTLSPSAQARLDRLAAVEAHEARVNELARAGGVTCGEVVPMWHYTDAAIFAERMAFAGERQSIRWAHRVGGAA